MQHPQVAMQGSCRVKNKGTGAGRIEGAYQLLRDVCRFAYSRDRHPTGALSDVPDHELKSLVESARYFLKRCGLRQQNLACMNKGSAHSVLRNCICLVRNPARGPLLSHDCSREPKKYNRSLRLSRFAILPSPPCSSACRLSYQNRIIRKRKSHCDSLVVNSGFAGFGRCRDFPKEWSAVSGIILPRLQAWRKKEDSAGERQRG